MSHPVADALAALTDAAIDADIDHALPIEQRRAVARHRIKARAYHALANQKGRSFKRGAFTVTVAEAPTYVFGQLVLSLTITRTATGKDVTPTDLNPIRIWNPPVLVDDPAGDIVQTSTDPKTGVVTTRKLREDLPAALLDTLGDLARQRLG